MGSGAVRQRPNVLLITTGQMRRDHMGCWGNTRVRTPNLDDLAAEGILLDRAYVSNPLSTPNRATIATGRLPSNHRAWCNGISLDPSEGTIANVLGEHGYETALLGKGHLTPLAAPSDMPGPNFDSRAAWKDGTITSDWTGPYYGFAHCQLSLGHGMEMLSLGHYGAWMDANFPGLADRVRRSTSPSPTGAMQCFTPDLPVSAHVSTWLARAGEKYLRSRADDERPFFCWVSFPDPHHPFCPPRPYDTLHDPRDVAMPACGAEALGDKPPHFRRARRGGEPWEGISPDHRLDELTGEQLREIIARTYGMISLVDESVGAILAALRETRLDRNTIVIFTSDHGDLMGDCGLLFKGPFHLEGLIGVPMIWRMPGGPAGLRSSGLFNSCDIAPTILELLGIDAPTAMDGLAQADLLRDGRSKRDAAFVEFKSMYHEELNLRTIITANRKLTWYPSSDVGELYDMTAETPEAINRWHDPAFANDRHGLQRRLLDELILRQDDRTQPICHT